MGKSRRKTTFIADPRMRRSRRFLLEGLEARCLLSVSPSQFAGVNATATAAVNETSPAANIASDGDLTFPASGYTPAQITAAYGFDNIASALGAAGGDGTGQTIAIVDAYHDPNLAADVSVFNQQFNLPDLISLQEVDQDGGTALPASDRTWSRETALDVEWAHAIAPGAKIVVVEAKSDQLADLLTAVDTARHIESVSVVSISWGVNEFASETAFDYLFTTPANHQPVTFLASTGDRTSPSQLQWPSTSPNVVAVGGTSLTLTNSGTTAQESPWLGSTVGLSSFESTPTYQDTPSRAVPDVVYNADPSPGFDVYDSADGGWETLGGTSAGTPQWAALVAIANQARASQGKTTLDGPTQTLPQLYNYYHQSMPDLQVIFNTAVINSGTLNVYSSATGSTILTLSGAGSLSFVQTFNTVSDATPSQPQNQAPVNTNDPRLKDKHARAWVVIDVQPTPVQVLSAAGFGHAANHEEQQAAVVSSSAKQTSARQTEAVASDLGIDDTPAIPGVGSSMYAAGFSASIAPLNQGIALPASFTGLLTTASQFFAETEVVPIGVGSGATQAVGVPYYISHLNVSTIFCDAVAGFINECAARPQTIGIVEQPAVNHTRAWAVTGAVMAIDGLILHHLALRRRGKNKSRVRDREEGVLTGTID